MIKKYQSRLKVILLLPLILFCFPLLDSEEVTLEGKEITNNQARLEYARVLSYLKRYDESIHEYQLILQTDPGSTKARMEMAKVLFYQGKVDEALQELSQVPSKDIDDATWILIADIYSKKKDYKKAENIYSQSLQKTPEDDKTRLKLAEILSWQKRYDESIYQYQALIGHHPNDIQLRRKYAQVLTWMGNDDEAAIEWEKTLK